MDNLKWFRECDNFVEYHGEYYYIGDDIESLKNQGFEFEESEFEESEFEISSNINLRQNIGASKLDSNFYQDGYNLGESVNDIGLRVLDDKGGLSDSDYIILRELTETNFDISCKPDHVIYSKEYEKYFCLKRGCKDCKVKPFKVISDYTVVAMDIAAQEPLVSFLLSREKEWERVFQLKNFKGDKKLLDNMHIIFENELDISRFDSRFINYIHDRFFFDRSIILKLNKLVNKCKLNKEENFNSLKELVEYIIQDFKDYETNKN